MSGELAYIVVVHLTIISGLLYSGFMALRALQHGNHEITWRRIGIMVATVILMWTEYARLMQIRGAG